MALYWFNVFYDPYGERLPGKGIFLSIANEDEIAAKRNEQDLRQMYPEAKFVARISVNLPEGWRKT